MTDRAVGCAVDVHGTGNLKSGRVGPDTQPLPQPIRKAQVTVTYPPYDPNSGYGQPDPYGQQPNYGGEPTPNGVYQQPDYYSQPGAYPSQPGPAYPGQASGPAYPGQTSGPGYPGQPAGYDPGTGYDPAYGQYQQPPSGYQQPTGYQQPPGYQPPGGGSGGNRGLLIGGLAGGGALVIVVIIVIVVALSVGGGDDPEKSNVAASASNSASAKPSDSPSSSPSSSPSDNGTGTGYQPPSDLCDKVDYSPFKDTMGGGGSPASNSADSDDPAILVCTDTYGNYGTTSAMVTVTGVFEKTESEATDFYGYYRDNDSKSTAKKGTIKDTSGVGTKSFRYESKDSSGRQVELDYFVVDGNLLIHITNDLEKDSGSWSSKDLDKMYGLMKETASGTLDKLSE